MLPIAFGLLIWCPAIIGWGIATRRVSGQGVVRDSLDRSDASARYLALTCAPWLTPGLVVVHDLKGSIVGFWTGEPAR